MNTKRYFSLPLTFRINLLTTRNYFILFIIFSFTCIFGYYSFSQNFKTIHNTIVTSSISYEFPEYSSSPDQKSQIFAATDDVSDSYYNGNDNYQFPAIYDLKLLRQHSYKTFIDTDSNSFTYQLISIPNLRSPPQHS